MKKHIMKALGAAGSAGALTLLCLAGVGAGGAAAAAPAPAQAGHAVSAASLTVPASFQPAAASFTSAAKGVVLGGSGCAVNRPCRAQLAVTADSGARWSLMRAPAVWLANVRYSLPQVNSVLSAGRGDVWLYYQYNSGHIWATRDSGASWREITLPAAIETMAATPHAVYAVAGDRLYRSPLGRNAWTRVGAMTGSTLAVLGNSVWFANGTYLWTTADGVHWARYALHSPGRAYGVPYGLAGIAAASPRDVAFLWGAAQGMYHTVMRVQVSFNGGRTERYTPSAPPSAGDTYGFAVTPGRLGVMAIGAVTPGPDLIYRSANLGRTWTTYRVPRTGGGISLGSLEFMSPTAGCFVVGNPAYGIGGQLMWTGNAGRTWFPVRF